MLSRLLSAAVLAVGAVSQTINVQSTGNPLLADGSYYSADPAPFVVGDTFYILSGRDEAGPRTNDFIMNQWMLWSSKNASAVGQWTLDTNVAAPQTLFTWATTGRAYASQIIQGKDGKFYIYTSVFQSRSNDADKFAIGVAVADNPAGPWKDAKGGPIISQSITGNNIQNIDPTVYVDTDGKVYLYWGTFGQLYGTEIASDMVTPIGTPTRVTTLTGFFEASWLTKRSSTWYMLYAGNNAGPTSPCTPTSYHACIAYGTAPSALGPWTYRGTILDVVSSTTSHSGAVQFQGKWYFTYHTADATNATHFRRSIAIDELTFDDTQSPPRINKITPSRRPAPPRVPTRNIAPLAVPSSVGRTPIQYWVAALNNQKAPANPLPPDYWSSYAGTSSPASSTLVYTWPAPVTLNGASMVFFADQPAGSSVGVAPPRVWRLEYQDASGAWVAVRNTTAYVTAVTDSPAEVRFEEVRTGALRAVLEASGGAGGYAGVGVKEWEALAPVAQ
ncbi:hypothetical protein KVT40_002386 [Elsinoe batatas]|uniref:Glycosyl hydrolase family 43 protein n=1 Tax=Elsinoe batatas TaxID=2601811 RepID=A0A8K0PJQ7_9PEZI|nr:hypothetical protein KVT40_002386 [Elsinoe batatas]